jgi:hypothetical protein
MGVAAVNPSVTLIGFGAVLAASGRALERWASARPPVPVPLPTPAPLPAPLPCPHARVVDVPGVFGEVVARLCLDCDQDEPVRSPAWP